MRMVCEFLFFVGGVVKVIVGVVEEVAGDLVKGDVTIKSDVEMLAGTCTAAFLCSLAALYPGRRRIFICSPGFVASSAKNPTARMT